MPCRIVPPAFDPIQTRVTDARQLRIDRADAQAAQATPPPPQPCNGDEDQFPLIANFAKSLAHDDHGVVASGAYAAFLDALRESHVCTFDARLEDQQAQPAVEHLGTVAVPPPPPTPPDTGNVLIYQERDGGGTPMGCKGARLVLDNPLAGETFSLEGADPQTVGLFDLRPPNPGATGYNPKIVPVPAPPKFDSKTEIAEIAENYWMALLRDVPFKYYTKAGRNADVTAGILSAPKAAQIAALVDAAVDDLNTHFGFYYGESYNGATGGKVTEKTLFRGFTAGDRVGPYVSQFFVRPVPEGRLTTSPKQKTAAMRNDYGGDPTIEVGKEGRDYMTTSAEWLSRQRGWVPRAAPLNTLDPNFDVESRLIRSGRDAGEYVHADVVFQEYFNACFILFAAPTARTALPRDMVYQDLDPAGTALPFAGGLFDTARTLAPEIPYQFSRVEKGFITLGNHDVKSMIGEVARRALLTVWYYKWNVHRRLRPEEFAGRIDEQKRHGQSYPFHPGAQGLAALDDVLGYVTTANHTNPTDSPGCGKPPPPPEASYLLPMQFPEGCPVHPSYGAGHATTAGACVTLLKALFNDELLLKDLHRIDASGDLVTYFVPVEPSADGRRLEVYADNDAHKMTLGGELDKLASNVSLFRNIAGVHWRSDHTYSLLLGQAVAINYLADVVNTYSEEGSGTDHYGTNPKPCANRPPLSFTLRTFEGYRIRIAKGASSKPVDCVTVIASPPSGSVDLSGIYNPAFP
jgi:hypothetical protein